jgi:nicotinamide-nucleotide amidase
MYPFDEINTIKNRLIGSGQTVAAAESVTSGHLQAALSLAENARQFYQGGITAYNLGQKTRHLMIEPIHALDCDCVSERVAAQMALEIARLFSANYGLSVTGYAAEVPEKNILRPFAFFSICRDGKILTVRRVETADAQEMERSLGAFRPVVDFPGAPAETVKALTVQLWFTRQVLETFAALLTAA